MVFFILLVNSAALSRRCTDPEGRPAYCPPVNHNIQCSVKNLLNLIVSFLILLFLLIFVDSAVTLNGPCTDPEGRPAQCPRRQQ